LFGDSSLIRINNPEWHEQRVILNKAFTSNKIFFEPMEKKVLQCVAKWRGGHLEITIMALRLGRDYQSHCSVVMPG